MPQRDLRPWSPSLSPPPIESQWNAYSYVDKAQEAKRQAEAFKPGPSAEEMQKRREQREEKRKTNTAWSDKTRKKEEREKRREKKDRKKKWEKAQAKTGAGTNKVGAKHGLRDVNDESGEADEEDDWDALAREERVAKRVKQGHLSQTAFDAEFGGL